VTTLEDEKGRDTVIDALGGAFKERLFPWAGWILTPQAR